jgi:cytidine deaminase
MNELILKSKILVYQMSELTDNERQLVEQAIKSTEHSYAPFSHFHVGAALLLANGNIVVGCNQENAVFPAGICAERSAIHSAGAQFPDQPIVMLAIAARNATGQLTAEPVSPCGICRQAIVETETRYKRPIRILLYGQKEIYVADGIKELLPLAFRDF